MPKKVLLKFEDSKDLKLHILNIKISNTMLKLL